MCKGSKHHCGTPFTCPCPKCGTSQSREAHSTAAQSTSAGHTTCLCYFDSTTTTEGYFHQQRRQKVISVATPLHSLFSCSTFTSLHACIKRTTDNSVHFGFFQISISNLWIHGPYTLPLLHRQYLYCMEFVPRLRFGLSRSQRAGGAISTLVLTTCVADVFASPSHIR